MYLCNMKKVLLFVGLLALACEGWGQNVASWRLAFWNVENFFDIWHDTLKNDLAFTPSGDNHWTAKRLEDKRNKIFKVIASMEYPIVVGLAEVENDKVLRELCLGTPLRKMKYDFVHYESPDQRGVDCALLYRKDRFKVLESRPICVSDSAEGFFTRDILMVKGVTLGKKEADTCYIFVNHWPSKLGGAVADRHRLQIAQRLMNEMDSVKMICPESLVIAMGDFNVSSSEEAVAEGLEFRGNCMNDRGFYSLMYQVEPGMGTYKYQDSWSCIDQVFCNQDLEVEIFVAEGMLIEDAKYLGYKPFRTYLGMKYQGGYSDHLPVIVTVQ